MPPRPSVPPLPHWILPNGSVQSAAAPAALQILPSKCKWPAFCRLLPHIGTGMEAKEAKDVCSACMPEQVCICMHACTWTQRICFSDSQTDSKWKAWEKLFIYGNESHQPVSQQSIWWRLALHCMSVQLITAQDTRCHSSVLSRLCYWELWHNDVLVGNLTLDRESEICSLKLLQVTMNQRQEQHKESPQPRPVAVSLGQAFTRLGGMDPWQASLPVLSSSHLLHGSLS